MIYRAMHDGNVFAEGTRDECEEAIDRVAAMAQRNGNPYRLSLQSRERGGEWKTSYTRYRSKEAAECGTPR